MDLPRFGSGSIRTAHCNRCSEPANGTSAGGAPTLSCLSIPRPVVATELHPEKIHVASLPKSRPSGLCWRKRDPGHGLFGLTTPEQCSLPPCLERGSSALSFPSQAPSRKGVLLPSSFAGPPSLLHCPPRRPLRQKLGQAAAEAASQTLRVPSTVPIVERGGISECALQGVLKSH